MQRAYLGREPERAWMHGKFVPISQGTSRIVTDEKTMECDNCRANWSETANAMLK